MIDKEVQQEKQYDPIVRTEFGIVIFNNEEHPSKHLCPIVETESGIMKVDKEEQ